MAHTDSSSKPLGFLDLPARINDSCLSLRKTCRQIYYEAQVPYSTCTFSFISTTDLFGFLYRIGFARRKELRKVCFVWDGSYQNKAFRLLRKCSNLKHVRILYPDPPPRDPAYLPVFAPFNESDEELCDFDEEPYASYGLMEVRGLETVEIQGLEDHYREELQIAMQRPRPLSDSIRRRQKRGARRYARRASRRQVKEDERRQAEISSPVSDIEESIHRLFLDETEPDKEA